MKTIEPKDRNREWLNSHEKTTGIGSLPHHNVDTALEYSFQFGIPFLPQIPIRNPGEFMIAQALEGLPGLEINPHGDVTLNLSLWQSRTPILNEKLKQAFQNIHLPEAFSEFEPSSIASSCWQPFLWELQERNIPVAKTQIMGPLTAQWVLTAQRASTPETSQYPELTTQIFRLILAKSIAMCRALQLAGTQPIIYLDEPGFYLLDLQQPRHVLALQELKLVVQTLKREGALVGIHCCSNTAWEAILDLGLDILSIDANLSLKTILEMQDGYTVSDFIQKGGMLSLGVIPTGQTRATDLQAHLPQLDLAQSFNSKSLAHSLLQIIQESFDLAAAQNLIKNCYWTPACGLGLHRISEAERILEQLKEVYAHFNP